MHFSRKLAVLAILFFKIIQRSGCTEIDQPSACDCTTEEKIASTEIIYFHVTS